MKRQSTLTALALGAAAAAAVGLFTASPAMAVVADEVLTSTSQIRTASNNPFFGAGTTQNLVGVNFWYSDDVNGGVGGSVPAGATVNGLAFDNIDLRGPTPNSPPTPTGPFTLTANPPAKTLNQSLPFSSDNGERNQTAATTGPDAATLDAVANEMFYLSNGGNHPSATFNFSGLGANQALFVQVIGGDQGWGGDLDVSANGAAVGRWTNVSDTNMANAGLFSFDTAADAGGQLSLNFVVGDGNFAGISGIVITGEVPEPAALGSLAAAAACLGLRRRRRRA